MLGIFAGAPVVAANVTLCATFPASFVQVTVPPLAIVTDPGENEKTAVPYPSSDCCMEIDAVPAAAPAPVPGAFPVPGPVVYPSPPPPPPHPIATTASRT
jgi:hypothetical protein